MPSNIRWFDRQLQTLHHARGSVLLVADATWGTSHLIAALSEPKRPLIWVQLAPRDLDDAVSQHNHLADAVRRALGSPLFGYGMPYRYGLNVLNTHLELLGPFTFALCGAEYGLDFARDLPTFARDDNHVVLQFNTLPATFTIPEGVTVLTPDDLRLSQRDALALAGGRLPEEEVLQLWRDAEGAYETFQVVLHDRLDLPVFMRPSPAGLQLPPGHEVNVEPKQLLGALIHEGRWLYALEVAAQGSPERAPEVLAEAGHVYHVRGLHRRLWQLLSHLPQEIKQSEVALFWRLSAASRLGRLSEVKAEVEDYLSTHEAPELRALYAGVLAPRKTRLAEAERAYKAAKTSLTVYEYGWVLRDPVEAEPVLREAVELAEREGRDYEVVRNTGALASKLITAGKYKEAAHRAGWALEQFARAGMEDTYRRLSITNDWAYARILIGETAGLEEVLLEGQRHLAEVHPYLARTFRSTIGDYYLATGQPEKAKGYYQENRDKAKRNMIGSETNNLVRAMLELGEVDAAYTAAEHAFYLTKGERTLSASRARLAYGMALSLQRPQGALELLQQAYEALQEPVDADLLAQAALYLARTQLLLDDAGGAKATLEGAKVGLSELADVGLRMLAGPEEAFADVFPLLKGSSAPLELRFLGNDDVRLKGTSLERVMNSEL